MQDYIMEHFLFHQLARTFGIVPSSRSQTGITTEVSGKPSIVHIVVKDADSFSFTPCTTIAAEVECLGI